MKNLFCSFEVKNNAIAEWQLDDTTGTGGQSLIQALTSFKEVKRRIIYFDNFNRWQAHFLLQALHVAGLTKVDPIQAWEDPYVPELVKDRIAERYKRLIKLYEKRFPDIVKCDKYIREHWQQLVKGEYSEFSIGEKNVLEIVIGTEEALPSRHGVKKGKRTRHIRTTDLRGLDGLFNVKITGMRQSLEHYTNISYNLVPNTTVMRLFAEAIGKELAPINWRITQPATAFQALATHIGADLYAEFGFTQTIIGGAKRYYKGHKYYYEHEVGNLIMGRLFPVNELAATDETTGATNHEVLRQYFYKPGIIWANPNNIAWLTRGTKVDYIGFYLAIMMSELPMPVGKITIGDDPDKPFKFYKLTIKRSLWNTSYVPFIYNADAHAREDKYKDTLSVLDIIYITTAELHEFHTAYKCSPDDYDAEVMYCTATKPARYLFEHFCDYFGDWKMDDDVIRQLIGKGIINTVQGKFATRMRSTRPFYIPELNKWVEVLAGMKAKYIPIGIAITAYGRAQMVRVIGANRDSVLTMNTDGAIIKHFDAEDFRRLTVGKRIGNVRLINNNKEWLVRGINQHASFDNDLNLLNIVHSGIDTAKANVDPFAFLPITASDYLRGFRVPDQVQTLFTPTGLVKETGAINVPAIWNNADWGAVTTFKMFHKGKEREYEPQLKLIYKRLFPFSYKHFTDKGETFRPPPEPVEPRTLKSRIIF